MLSRQNLLLLGIFGFLFLAIWLLVGNKSPGREHSSNKFKLPEKISFNFHVKPILSDRCFACHGPDENKRKAGLRLDVEEVAKAELSENPGKFAIVPGEADKSELVFRVFSEDESVMMPPPDSHLKIGDNEKAILKKWIDQGATYEPHWAFIPPEKAELPVVKNKTWAENEIDYFILKTIEENGLKPSGKASKSKLIRRWLMLRLR